ncbi:hypothetical protein ACH3O9_11280 [Leeuwenhoekiella sp. A16]|uniref:hypothetical protein n=1 Tax=Leeuwenhoekiella sp. A16 TaxID=3141462 RepID=UPI003A808D7F
MIPTCFQIFFNPIYLYIKRVWDLASDNHYVVLTTSAVISFLVEIISEIWEIELFGIPNAVLLILLITILVDAFYGVKKSKKESKVALAESLKYEPGTPEFKKLMKIYELKKFNPQKLQFTAFKALTLVAYLYCVNQLTADTTNGSFWGVALGITSSVVINIPVFLFWYRDFKSIGNNTEYIYEKKAPIFTYAEAVIELKFKEFLTKEKE